MERYIYETEILKNYFIINGGFSGLSEKESRMYNGLAQDKFKGFGGKPIIDIKAPGGMQTLFYALMGFDSRPLEGAPMGRVEPYAVFLATLMHNEVDLTTRELNHLKLFLEYYGFEKYKDFIQKLNLIKFTKYSLADTLLTASVYSLIEGRREREFKEYVSSLKLNNIYELIVDKAEESQQFLESLLPPVVMSEANTQVIVKEGVIIVPSNMKIIWKDLMLMASIGLKYRGLYRPQFQLGAYMTDKMTGNLLYLNPGVLMSDELHRRKFGLSSLIEFWGVKEPFPQVSMSKGYTIYPFFDNGNYTGKQVVEELYCIWMPPNLIVVDKFMLGYIHPVVSKIFYTDSYVSQFYQTGYMLPCIMKEGVPVPLPEAIAGRVPSNGDFTNLTSYNLGIGV